MKARAFPASCNMVSDIQKQIGEIGICQINGWSGPQASEKIEKPMPAAAQQPDAYTIDLLELMYRLLSKWKLIVSSALLFALAAGVYTVFFVTPMYQATSTIYVLSRSDSAINMADLQIGSELTQ